MNGLHGTTMKIKVYRVFERISEGATISTVVSISGVPGFVAERNPVVLIGSVLRLETLKPRSHEPHTN
jgi:hypothetical protein